MWRFTILITVAVVGLVEASCTYKACPDYTVIEKHPEYEVRTYGPLTWATTSFSSRSRIYAVHRAYRRLSMYAKGMNDQNQMMEMTVPVRMSPTKSGNETIWKMDLMVASQFAANPPVPNDDNVKIVKEDTTTYAVRTFDGFIWADSLLLDAAYKLAKSVKDDDTVIRTRFFHVGFYSPTDILLLNQEHEIWMVKKVEQQINEV